MDPTTPNMTHLTQPKEQSELSYCLLCVSFRYEHVLWCVCSLIYNPHYVTARNPSWARNPTL